MKFKPRGLLTPPLAMKFGMMVAGVVGDDHRPLARRPSSFGKFAKESPAGFAVEASGLPLVNQLSISKPNGSEVTNAFSGRVVINNWLRHFRWNPHPSAGSILLEMDLVQSPKLNLRIPHHEQEFFCVPGGVEDRLGQSWGAVCATEIPNGGTCAGIGASPTARGIVDGSRSRASCHPTDCNSSPPSVDPFEEPDRSQPSALSLNDSDDRDALRPQVLADRALRSARPSIGQFEAHLQGGLTLGDNSIPRQPEEPRADGDHTEPVRNDGFLLGAWES